MRISAQQLESLQASLRHQFSNLQHLLDSSQAYLANISQGQALAEKIQFEKHSIRANSANNYLSEKNDVNDLLNQQIIQYFIEQGCPVEHASVIQHAFCKIKQIFCFSITTISVTAIYSRQFC